MNKVKNSKISVWLRVLQSFFLVLLVVFMIIAFVDPSSADALVAGGTSFSDLMRDIQTIVGFVIGLLAALMIIIGGIVYATSSGDTGKIGLGKEIIMSAIAGLLLFMFALWFLGDGSIPGIIDQYFPPTG